MQLSQTAAKIKKKKKGINSESTKVPIKCFFFAALLETLLIQCPYKPTSVLPGPIGTNGA